MTKRILSLLLSAMLVMLAIPALATTAAWQDGQVKLVNEPDDFSEDAALFSGANEDLVPEMPWVDGLHGKGVDFKGIKDHIRFDGALITANEALTLSTWVFFRGPGLMEADKMNETAGGVLIFGTSGTAGHFKVVAVDDEKGGGMSFAGGLYNQDVYAVADKPLPTDVWSMVTVTLDGTNMSLYLNGELLAQAAQTVVPKDLNLDLFRIGSSFWGPPSLNAIVDDASIWNRALTAEEITAMYEATKPAQ
jgi:hypothetical protein